MNSVQYYEQIANILRTQVEKKIIIYDEKLEEFKRIKPVPLGVQLMELLNNKFASSDISALADFEKSLPIIPDYPHLELSLGIIKEIYLEEKHMMDVERLNVTEMFLSKDYESFFSEYEYLEQQCNKSTYDDVERLGIIKEQLYKLEDAVAQTILKKITYIDNCDIRNEWFLKEPNMGFLIEELDRDDSCFVLIENNSNVSLVDFLAKGLVLSGKKVILVKSPLSYETDEIEIKDTVAISIENIQIENDLIVVTPIQTISKTKRTEDNISYLLEYINNHYNNAGYMNVIGQGYQIDEISVRPFTNKKMTRLSQFYYEKREYNLAFARYGNYLDYISKIYCKDCKELLDKRPTMKFSIVIPARDSIDTLQHTVRTALEQDYEGDFEVVISDNSIKNTKVYDYFKDLNHPKVVYVKTPRNLSLAKSFEFAYLHTSGEYVFSIGSDDGVLPWALTVLDAVTSNFPEEKVINWPRGFYAWPGFNYGQQHQLSIVNKSTAQQFAVYYRDSDDYLKDVLNNPQNMYLLPLLYINSCFKREFLKDILEETGELIDGNSQDIYTGLMTIALNQRILNISVALTIAGMSSASVGSNSDKAKDIKAVEEQKKAYLEAGSVGMNVQTLYEHLVPVLGSDVSALYFALMRAVSKGIFSENLLENTIDWEKIFTQIVNVMRLENITYFQDLYKTRYAASLHGESFFTWFDSEVLKEKCQLCILNEDALMEARKKRTYKVGLNASGGITCDASELGVKNVYEAVKEYTRIVLAEES